MNHYKIMKVVRNLEASDEYTIRMTRYSESQPQDGFVFFRDHLARVKEIEATRRSKEERQTIMDRGTIVAQQIIIKEMEAKLKERRDFSSIETKLAEAYFDLGHAQEELSELKCEREIHKNDYNEWQTQRHMAESLKAKLDDALLTIKELKQAAKVDAAIAEKTAIYTKEARRDLIKEMEALDNERKFAIKKLNERDEPSPTSPITHAEAFIHHIQDHLKPGEQVLCTICGKSAMEITGYGTYWSDPVAYWSDPVETPPIPKADREKHTIRTWMQKYRDSNYGADGDDERVRRSDNLQVEVEAGRKQFRVIRNLANDFLAGRAL